MLLLILTLIFVGFFAGILARMIVPGNNSMSFASTVGLGLVGSFVGGFLGYLLFKKDEAGGALQPSGFVGSVLGAVVALVVYKAVNNRGSTR